MARPGTYNLEQPEIANRLGDNKAAVIERLQPDAVAAGNVGCLMQIESHLRQRKSTLPVLAYRRAAGQSLRFGVIRRRTGSRIPRTTILSAVVTGSTVGGATRQAYPAAWVQIGSLEQRKGGRGKGDSHFFLAYKAVKR